MTDEELEGVLVLAESDRVERKRSASDMSAIHQAVCAFANDLPDHQEPGVLFIGVEGNGDCTGLEISDELLRRLDDLFEAHISVASDIVSQAVETRRPDYPIVALQQLARNAILHRTYDGTNAPVRISWFDDRIEILNPGGPFGQVTRENFGTPGITDYRNPHLAEVMKNLGYVQRFGVGIPLARRHLEANGNPPPEFVIEGSHVLVILRRAS